MGTVEDAVVKGEEGAKIVVAAEVTLVEEIITRQLLHLIIKATNGDPSIPTYLP